MTLVKNFNGGVPSTRKAFADCVYYVPNLLEMNEFCTLTISVCTGRDRYIGQNYLDNPARYDRAKHPATEYSLNHF